MKVLAIVLALAVFGVNAADNDVAADVRAEIEKILEQLNEPLVDVHDKKYTLDLVVEKVEIDLIDFELKGIKALEIKQLDYDDTTGRLDYDLTIPDVEIDLDFDLALSGLINIDHHPTATIDLTELKLAGYAVVDTSVEPNQLTDFKLLVSLGGTEVELTNILNDDELTTTLIDLLNKTLPTVVDNIAEVLEPAVSPIIQSAINIILRHVDN